MNRPGIWDGLIGFDILRARRSCETVLARWQDRLVLLLMAIVAIFAVASALDRPPGLAVAPAWAALAALFLGILVAAAHDRRLESLSCRSIAAPLALAPSARAAHLAAFSILALILALASARAAAMSGLFAWPGLALILGGWAAGTLIGAAGAALWRRRRRSSSAATLSPALRPGAAPASEGLLAITLRTQLPFREPQPALLAAFLLGAAQAAGAGIWAHWLNPFAGGVVAVTMALVPLFAVARVPAGPCRFGTFAGVPTAHAIAAHLAALSAVTLGALAGALVHFRANPGLVWLELGCGLVALAAVAFRVLHYRLDPKLRADRLMQLQIALLAMAAAGLPPLAPLLVAFRAVVLYRANRNAMWAVS